MSLDPKDIPSTSSQATTPNKSPNKSPNTSTSSISPRSLSGVINMCRESITDLTSKITAMKKSSKSGNKKQQKEVKEQIEKLEKELEEKQRQEKEEEMTGNEFLLTSISGPPPSQTGEKVDSSSGEEDSEEESSGGGGFADKVYRTFKISNRKQKQQQKAREKAEREDRAVQSDEERKRKEQGAKHLEKQQIKALLAKNSLRMVDIPADGDCMYQSVSHQLLEEGIEISARKLRIACAGYMREHREELEPFITEADINTTNTTSSKKAVVDDPSLSLWDKYLRGVENMADSSGAWGGEMELKVVSELYKKVILVYSIGSENPHKIGDQFSSPKDRPLRLVYLRHAFTLGEHYNSTLFV